MPGSGYRELVAWQRAMELSVSCYRLSESLRRGKHAALAPQLQRAAVSVPANIAEGKGRGGRAEYARFVTIALGSLREVETLVCLAERIGAAPNETCSVILRQCDEVGKVTYGLGKSLRKPG